MRLAYFVGIGFECSAGRRAALLAELDQVSPLKGKVTVTEDRDTLSNARRKRSLLGAACDQSTSSGSDSIDPTPLGTRRSTIQWTKLFRGTVFAGVGT